MDSLGLYLSAALAILRRDIQMFMTYRLRFISQVVSLLFGVALFYYVSRLVSVRQFPTHAAYFGFVVVGMAVMELVTSSVRVAPINLRSELVAGTFERMVVSPYGPLGGVIALSLFPMALAVVTSTIILIVGALLFGLALHWSTVPYAVPAALLGMLAFLPITLLIAAAVLLVKQAGNLATFLLSGLALVGGSFFPVSVLPGSLRWISNIQPLTPTLDLMRHELIGAHIADSPWIAAAKLGGFAVVLLPLSLLAITTALRFCRNRGTLIEY
jgi:ABC-2 type transport system permease protein